MKKSLALLITVLLVLTLIVPATVLASGKSGGGNARGKAARAANAPVTSSEHPGAGQANKAAKLAAKDARKAAKLEARGLPKSPKSSRESSSTTPAVKPSVDGAKSVGPGVANALNHILANIARRAEKVGEAIPQGLANVWFKFSTWLGISTETRPWVPVVEPVGDNPPAPVITTPPPSMITSVPPGVFDL